MARKKAAPHPGPLPAPPSPAAEKESESVPALPVMLEYQPAGDRQPWRVDRFPDLATEFFTASHKNWAETMARFHAVAASYPRGWDFIRKLFGVAPLMPSEDDDLRVWPRAELAAQQGLQVEQLRAELDVVRLLWQKRIEPIAPAPPPAPSESVGQPELPAIAAAVAEENLLAELGFAEQMFDINVLAADGQTEVPRAAAENARERAWFIERIGREQWREMLRETISAVVAREAILNELALRRLDRDMSQVNPRSKQYQELRSTKRDIYEQYQQQLAELREMFPEQNLAGKVQARVTLGGLIKAVLAYKADPANELVDGIRTLHEVDLELTPSAQAPLPAYRQGQNTYLIEANHHLFDANHRSQLRPRTLRILDLALPKAWLEIREALALPLPDLEKGVLPGEGDDFEDFPNGGDPASEVERIANS